MEILQNFMAFSEFMNFNILKKLATLSYSLEVEVDVEKVKWLKKIWKFQ